MIKKLLTTRVLVAVSMATAMLIGPFANPANAVNGYPLTPFYQVAGKYVLSTDGLGTTQSSGNIQVEKPSATAVVRKAFFMSSARGGSTVAPTAASLLGTQVTYSKTVSGQALADVTSIVSSTVDNAQPGIINIAVTNANQAEGHALAVVFYDANLSYSASVVLSFGRADTVGSSTEFDFSNVLSKQSYMDVTMTLGLSFSYQSSSQANSYSCLLFSGCTQRSQISLTLDGSSTPIYVSATAGGSDDAAQAPANGNLLSVGGVGDQVSKPVNSSSNQTTTTPIDNELYSLIDLLPNGTTGFTLNSVNPSNDDYLFFAGFYFKGIVAKGTDTSGNSSLPNITSVSPCFGPTSGGTSVTITGTNLASATSVTFGGTSAVISSNSATSIVATSPAKTAGYTDIEVTTSAGNAIQFDAFQYGNNLTSCEGSVEAAVQNDPSQGPTVPGTPGKPAASASGTTATVTVTAPSSGGTPTSYTVTASPGGATCTVTGASGSCSISGLIPGTSYTFTSTATNSAGTSSSSVASDAVLMPVSSSVSTTPGTTTSATVVTVAKKTTVKKPKATATPEPTATETAEPSVEPTPSPSSSLEPVTNASEESTQTGLGSNYGLLAGLFGGLAIAIWFIVFRRRDEDEQR